MSKNSKINFVEDALASSSSVCENLKKWCDTERERLASQGSDITKFVVSADPDINEGTILCEDYTLKFNRDEGLIDLIVNGTLDSPMWEDVIDNVPVQFATYLTSNSNFVFHFSNKFGDEMGFYEHSAWGPGLLPLFLELNDKWYAPIFRRCFSR